MQTLFKGKKTFSWCNDDVPSATVHWIGQIIVDNILDFDINRVMQRMVIGEKRGKEQLRQDFWAHSIDIVRAIMSWWS